LYELRTGKTFNVSRKCKKCIFGYGFTLASVRLYELRSACVKKINQDRNFRDEYIRIHEMKDGEGLKV